MSPKMGENLTLALALEGAIEPATAEMKQLVGIANALAQLPEPEIDATFANELEQLLLTDGQTQPVGRPQLTIVKPVQPATPEPVPADTVVRMPSKRYAVRRSLTAAVAAASLAAFPLVAAASSLPGSPFYGLKQLEHRIELALANGPVAEGFVQMRHANQFVSEAEQLAAFPNPDEGLIARTLAKGAEALRAGSALVLGNTSDPVALSRLADMAAATGRDVSRFAGELGNGAAENAAQQVIEATQGIQAAVAGVLGFSAGSAPIGSVDPAMGGVSAQGASAGPGSSTDPKSADDPQQPDRKDPNDKNSTTKPIRKAADDTCMTIGEAQFGTTFRDGSLAVCQGLQSASRF